MSYIILSGYEIGPPLAGRFVEVQLPDGLKVRGDSTCVGVQVVGETSRGVVQELVLTDLVGEVNVRDGRLGLRKADLTLETDYDGETAARIRPGLAHVGREILDVGVPGEDADQDFVCGDAHHQRTQTLDEGSHALVTNRVTLGPNRAVHLDVGVRWLSRHGYVSLLKVSLNANLFLHEITSLALDQPLPLIPLVDRNQLPGPNLIFAWPE
jgi:hypothetical protein